MLKVIEAYIIDILEKHGYRPWHPDMGYDFSNIKSDMVRYCLIRRYSVNINCWIWVNGLVVIRPAGLAVSYEKELDVHDPEFADQLLTFIRNAPIAIETRSSLKPP